MNVSAEANAARAAQYQRILERDSLLSRCFLPAVPDSGAQAPALCGVMSPALCEFVRWIIVTALHRGKKRLYFLARDGYFPFLAARIFCDRFDISLDCRYLSVSRAALRRPLIHLDHRQALEWIASGGIGITPERMLLRAGLQENECRSVFRELGLSLGLQEKLTRNGIHTIQRALSGCKMFWETADAHSRMLLPALTGYLRQEGLAEGRDDLLIDCGWVGSIQQALNTVCGLIGRKKRLEGCYFGLYELPAHLSSADYHTYFFAPHGPLKHKVYFNNNLFEAIFTAPHGMTTGYDETEHIFHPIYEDLPERRRKAVLQTQQLLIPGVHRCADRMGGGRFFSAPFDPARRTLSALFREMMNRPSKEEAEAFGSIPFSDDILGEEGMELAPVLNRKELRTQLLLPRMISEARGNGTGPPSPWYEGSAVRSLSRPFPFLLQYAAGQALRHQIKGWKKNPPPDSVP